MRVYYSMIPYPYLMKLNSLLLLESPMLYQLIVNQAQLIRCRTGCNRLRLRSKIWNMLSRQLFYSTVDRQIKLFITCKKLEWLLRLKRIKMQADLSSSINTKRIQKLSKQLRQNMEWKSCKQHSIIKILLSFYTILKDWINRLLAIYLEKIQHLLRNWGCLILIYFNFGDSNSIRHFECFYLKHGCLNNLSRFKECSKHFLINILYRIKINYRVKIKHLPLLIHYCY